MDTTLSLLAALAGFAFVTSITPGPNNLMLLASGTRFGWRRSLPHLLGISLGFGIMLALVGLGLGEVFDRLPWLHDVLKWVSLGYLLYLAAKVATAAPPSADGSAQGQPMSLAAAALFQVVNPKAWAMALTAVTVYGSLGVGAVTAVFVLVNLPCCGSWAVLGEQMRRWLHRPQALRVFNWGAAALMVVSVLPLLRG